MLDLKSRLGLFLFALVLLYVPVWQWLLASMLEQESMIPVLVLLLMIAIMYVRRFMLRETVEAGSRRAQAVCAVLVLGALWAAWVQSPLLQFMLLPLLLYAMVYGWGGAVCARLCRFPLLMMYFLLPYSDLLNDHLGFYLRLHSVDIATYVLHGFLPVHAEGTVLFHPDFQVNVVPACSGIRSLTVILLFGVFYAWLSLHEAWRRALLLLSLPVWVLLANGMRIAIVMLLGLEWGADVAAGFFHEFSGLLLFALVMLAMFFCAKLLSYGELHDQGMQASARPRQDDGV